MRFHKIIDILTRIFLALVLLIFAVPFSADSAPRLDSAKSKDNPPLNQSKDDTKKAAQNKQSSQESVVAPQCPQSQTKASDAVANTHQKTSAEWWVVFLTGALVAVGTCQIIAMFVQANWMRKTMLIARDSADAGQTPAYECRHCMIEAIYEGFPAPSKAFDKAPAALGRTVIAPGEAVEFFVDATTLSPEDEIKIANKTKAIYLFGEIAYTDAFDKQRVTKFRLVCAGESFRTGRFAPSEEGNQAT
jgi:hypothetical protein